jgi:flagellar M-ring protein FliF
MGFLNQSIAQMRDLFASMTPAARITAALLLAVIGVSLGYLFQGYSSGSKEFLFNGEIMQPSEVHAMEAALAKANLADYERQGGRIRVPAGKKAEYLAAIANEGALPPNFDTLMLDESSKLSMFSDSKTREARLQATRERMLSMMIRKMDGVEDAQVMYDIREPKGFERRQITATVSVRPTAGEALNGRRAKMIRLAVARSIAGLDPKDIAILNLADGSQVAGVEDLNADSFDERYFQVKTTYEEMMKRKVEDVLRDIPGVRVQITAELDESLGAETHTIEPKGDAQTISEETDQSEEKRTQVEDRGRPGLTVQGPAGTPPDEAVAKNEETNSTNTRTAQSWVPTAEEVKQSPGLVPKHVRAAIAVPSDFLVRVWRERTPDAPTDQRPTEDELRPIQNDYETRITKVVAPLFPREPAEDPYPNVQVTVFQSLTPKAIDPPTVVSEGLMWARENSGALIMAGLALVSLVMLRSMVKSIPTGETNVILQTPGGAAATGGGAGALAGADAEFGEGGTGESGGAAAAGGKGRTKLRLKKGPSLKEDLTDMVRDDPDAAAAILRTWISNAG